MEGLSEISKKYYLENIGKVRYGHLSDRSSSIYVGWGFYVLQVSTTYYKLVYFLEGVVRQNSRHEVSTQLKVLTGRESLKEAEYDPDYKFLLLWKEEYRKALEESLKEVFN